MKSGSFCLKDTAFIPEFLRKCAGLEGVLLHDLWWSPHGHAFRAERAGTHQHGLPVLCESQSVLPTKGCLKVWLALLPSSQIVAAHYTYARGIFERFLPEPPHPTGSANSLGEEQGPVTCV